MKASSQQKKPWRKWKCNLTSGRKYLEIMLSVKGLIPKIYKELTEQVNSIANKQTFQFKNRQRIRTFFNKSPQVINKPIKDASLIVREMQIKTAMRYHLIPVRMVIIKETKKSQCWWECKLVLATMESSMAVSQKWMVELPYYPAIPLLGIQPKEMKTLSWKDICISMYIECDMQNSRCGSNLSVHHLRDG